MNTKNGTGNETENDTSPATKAARWAGLEVAQDTSFTWIARFRLFLQRDLLVVAGFQALEVTHAKVGIWDWF